MKVQRLSHSASTLSYDHSYLTLYFFQVPRGLPYFAVDFGLQGGFAHVIENEQKFPHYFGKVSVRYVGMSHIGGFRLPNILQIYFILWHKIHV